eukprot:gb/GEZN01008147.1/.p1 GENE.gb/GEZN01008147.1/~~gb/GEZN01008147.1/.p1  ORF type:complete len:265 (-),score=28.50 gb/GEZN01008147.1/:107-901(-)
MRSSRLRTKHLALSTTATEAKERDGKDGNDVCKVGRIQGTEWLGYIDPVSGNSGVRATSFAAFVQPFIGNQPKTNKGKKRERGVVEVLTSHRVDKLLFQDGNDGYPRVIGVLTYNLQSKLSQQYWALEEVVVSAGTYNSPKLLMLSGIGPPQHLKDLGIEIKVKLPRVGRNLRDHYAVGTFWQPTGENANNPAPFLFQSPNLQMYDNCTGLKGRYQFELSANFGSVVPLHRASVGWVALRSNDAADDPLINPQVFNEHQDFLSL